MKKLAGLAQNLETLPGVTRDQMEAFADLGKLIPTGQDLGNGFEIGRFRYDAVISMERCPASIAGQLLSFLLIWLSENDPDRDLLELADPDVDVTMEDEQTVSVQISVEFDEALIIVEDPTDPISWNGKKWRVDDVPVDTATVLDKLDKR
ncbi:MAG: phage tail protein [Desulfobacter sp.]|nr:MAG: phage tail protein [Desulfobacter sp.]